MTQQLFAVAEGERAAASGAGLRRAVDARLVLLQVLGQAECGVALLTFHERGPVFAHVLVEVFLALVRGGALGAAPRVTGLMGLHVLGVPGK